MRTTAMMCLIVVAGTLTGCGGSGNGVEFVASNPDSVLLDFDAKPPGGLVTANDTAIQQCQIFNRRTAVLESLNVRDEGVIRATYLCRNSVETASATPAPAGVKRRQ